MAQKLGYTRGQTEDGGYFYEYFKRFPGSGIEVSIEFTGSRLPEKSKKVALKGLHFQKIKKETGYYFYRFSSLTLNQVPTVLLSETWNDLKQIALSGSGYDPDWELKIINDKL